MSLCIAHCHKIVVCQDLGYIAHASKVPFLKPSSFYHSDINSMVLAYGENTTRTKRIDTRYNWW
jgi:hypothetical protein